MRLIDRYGDLRYGDVFVIKEPGTPFEFAPSVRHADPRCYGIMFHGSVWDRSRICQEMAECVSVPDLPESKWHQILVLDDAETRKLTEMLGGEIEPWIPSRLGYERGRRARSAG